MRIPPLGQEDPLEKGKAAHSSILAWRIPWTVQSKGSQSRTRLSDIHSHLYKQQLRWNSAGTSEGESGRVKGCTLDGVLWGARQTELEARPQMCSTHIPQAKPGV